MLLSEGSMRTREKERKTEKETRTSSSVVGDNDGLPVDRIFRKRFSMGTENSGTRRPRVAHVQKEKHMKKTMVDKRTAHPGEYGTNNAFHDKSRR